MTLDILVRVAFYVVIGLTFSGGEALMRIKAQIASGFAAGTPYALPYEELSGAAAEQLRDLVRELSAQAANVTTLPGDADRPESFEITLTDGDREETFTIYGTAALNELVSRMNRVRETNP